MLGPPSSSAPAPMSQKRPRAIEIMPKMIGNGAIACIAATYRTILPSQSDRLRRRGDRRFGQLVMLLRFRRRAVAAAEDEYAAGQVPQHLNGADRQRQGEGLRHRRPLRLGQENGE